ncbi:MULTISPECIES: phosphatidate cytidylyltransferase [Paraburkholderia]|uniref:Phosphatidate cytidylyltransferase n=1 Tax=Paraburkholderia megapolitana TaxID=420953 RepID=A0A1I3L857_9BURK|nr:MULTISPECIES: phosphatidate cytidylyltransferase [Paraburkholderia]MCX4163290.1 phosphatidate cytidylyltransferase [Paraburkholderia megapolitana]MDN7158786.1 phosphatidate cytidylyltransferase [Paraburkholderia sp. CHISQ3]MDQ6495833.1 phosphatidate cytidylyltransferase [Paraburkholderia megapolitana]QDQ80593.1 phosphatidate cytidylyltransferase [Paraburkholderia megapolitana]SFI80615.1 phosphatidate cytidylyltransferase [Paraburkholderia megapolitana]
MRTVFWELVAGVTGFLAIASVIGAILAWRDGGKSTTIANLNQRIRAWWGMIAIMAIAIGLGSGATYIVFAIASYLTLREFITLTPTSPSDHTTLFIAFFIAIPVQYILLWVNWYGMFSIFVPVHLFITLSLVSALTQDTKEFLNRSAKIHWALMVCVYGLSYAPALLILDIEHYQGENALLLFFFLLVVQISDVFQYVVGKLFGKRKIAPQLSPSKTVEGFIGGGLLATLCGALLYRVTPFSFGAAFFMSLAIVLSGFVGGLVLSAVKRSLGAKDWGSMISGHGGALDRVDSICFAAPVFFHLVRYLYVK